MAQKATTAVLVVGGDAQRAGGVGHGEKCLAGTGGLHQALVARDDAVRAARVEAAAQRALAAGREGGRRLVAVAHGVGHAHRVQELGAVALEHVGEQLGHGALLALELDGVGNGEPLATAASLGDRASIRLVSHGSPV